MQTFRLACVMPLAGNIATSAQPYECFAGRKCLRADVAVRAVTPAGGGSWIVGHRLIGGFVPSTRCLA